MGEWIRWLVETALLVYICVKERQSLHINSATLRFYSEFVAARTKWYSSRTGKPTRTGELVRDSIPRPENSERRDIQPLSADSRPQDVALGDAIMVAESDQREETGGEDK